MQGLIIQPEGTRNTVWLMLKETFTNTAKRVSRKHVETCCWPCMYHVCICVHLCASRSWLRAHSTAAGPEMTTATIVLLASTACTAGVFLSGLPAEEDRLCRRSKEA